MPAAPSLPALLDFETQFEKAAQQILADSGILAFVSGQDEAMPLASTGVSFDAGAATDDTTFLPLAPGQDRPTRQEYFRYSGSLSLEVSVPRDEGQPATDEGVSTFLGQVRGRIRAAFLKSFWPFNDSNLPYLRVSNIRPTGTTTGTDARRHTDVLVMTFAVVFAIQPDAWPVGFPAE